MPEAQSLGFGMLLKTKAKLKEVTDLPKFI